MEEEKTSVRKNMIKIIEQNEVGHLFNYSDFKDCGQYGAIRTAIVDLCRTKHLERVVQGIFVKPALGKQERYIPDNITIAMEIDRKNGSKATPKGKTLEFINGRLSELPKELEFYSTGSGRYLKLPDGTLVKYTLRRE